MEQNGSVCAGKQRRLHTLPASVGVVVKAALDRGLAVATRPQACRRAGAPVRVVAGSVLCPGAPVPPAGAPVPPAGVPAPPADVPAPPAGVPAPPVPYQS